MYVFCFILYMICASICCFGYAYFRCKFANPKDNINYADTVMTGALFGLVWFLSIWVLIPYYLIIYLNKNHKIH